MTPPEPGRRWSPLLLWQRRMIRETELFLEEQLRRPAHARIVIPAVPVGAGGFPRGFADAFWSQLLGTS